MYIDSLVTNILKIKLLIQDNTGHKTCRRDVPFTVNSVQTLDLKNIKYIQKILNTKYLVRVKTTRKEIEGH